MDREIRDLSPHPSKSEIGGQSTPNRRRSTPSSRSNSDTHVLHRRQSQDSTSPGKGRGNSGSARGGSGRVSFRSILFAGLGGVLTFLKDLSSFLIRGGLSTLMFMMDQALSTVVSATSFIPGGTYIESAVRLGMWCFQLLMWVVYTALELNFYLPWKLLIIYIPVLAVIYIMMPKSVHRTLNFMFELVHWFLHAVKYYLY